MPFTITITVSDHTARWLRSMASLGRHCDLIDRTLLSTLDLSPSPTLEEAINFTLNCNEEAKQPLSELHTECRNALIAQGVKPLWNQNQS